jgi:two-component system, sensor histidine kinase and response regulator
MSKILVIDDEQDIREKILSILEYEGYQPLSAADGAAGIQLARSAMPDLIICDILMPGISGYGVLETLRSDPATARIPFIFLTAIGTKEDQRYGMTLGADDFLTKPFSVDELLAAIQTRLDKRAATAQELENLRLNLVRSLPHEFRTPLTAILGFTELLLSMDRELFPDINEILEMQQAIHDNALRLQRVIDNYLLYAKLRLMQSQAEVVHEWRTSQPLDTAPIITAAGQSQAYQAQRMDDLVVQVVEAQLPMREEHLTKIVQELSENAFKFSSPGSPVTLHTTADDTQFVLTIRDQGRGMTAEQIANIGAYMQFDRAYYEQQGLGLGLILTRLLTETYRGEFTIDSRLDQGTTITIAFQR